MESLIEQLRDDEALVTAYVLGELPPEDVATVERRVASEAEFAGLADRARRDYAAVQSALAVVDKGTRLPVVEEQAVRRVSRLIHQWHTGRLTHVPEPVAKEPIRIPAWAYPMAAGVALFVGFCFWWANNPPQVAVDTNAASATTEPVVGAGAPAPYAVYEMPEPLPLAFQDLHNGNAWDRLSGLEHEVSSLSDADDSAGGMLWTETNQ
jgi:hypothetical protein